MKDSNSKEIDSITSEKEINIDNFSRDELLEMLSKMILIRNAEYKIAKGREFGLVGGPVHLGVGQEAIPVGISQYLNNQDKVFGAHRSHSHILSLGIDLKSFFSEILAKSSGISKGMGGSMHLFGGSVGFCGSVPIVGGTVPLAVGTALASKLKEEKVVSISYLGDGAIEEGIVHESLNFARINNCPVIFVVENNLFSSHLNIKLRQPKKLTYRFAKANDIESKVLDGNNLTSICKTGKEFIRRCRDGEGPFFIEALTYRWFGHVDWREDIDVGINRSADDLKYWKKRDPILRLKKSLLKENYFGENHLINLEKDIQKDIDNAWVDALGESSPEWNESLDYVFKSNYK
ncbi:Pyruvate dehydrogenase (lipoamide) [Prochlorococcus marinus str. MIT 9312]|uniref:Pyruvate dehydrogenase (Lipoamide) n=1 Tax=Prochlorococcus marinus (strain MIT 9312) TaxID=74546 RepID=Q319T4_PROM9|nr:thiamine pyrophosphate-dependent dehydrogenase E1 component subunit alpha [Prochlorococcus marinus]ABB50361.1 Pyruvate dehydrogenase (lipoamide) [Prochlorococcus marinus str. MIT 9312]KGF99954.1 Pyruvate dehydrogenase E1 component alpha subunit [Prochlorococcus marinus str. MIT 9311]